MELNVGLYGTGSVEIWKNSIAMNCPFIYGYFLHCTCDVGLCSNIATSTHCVRAMRPKTLKYSMLYSFDFDVILLRKCQIAK